MMRHERWFGLSSGLVRCLFVIVLLGLGRLLAGCTVGTSSVTPTLPPVELVTPQPSRTAIRLPDTWTPAPTATSTLVPPSLTPSPTYTLPPLLTEAPTATPDPRLPVLNPVETLTYNDLLQEDNNVLHDLILFTSQAGKPLVGTNVGVPSSISLSGKLYAGTQLWAFSPDGQRAGRLTSQELALIIFWPESESEKILLVQEEGVTFNHERVQGLILPGECYGELPEDEQGSFHIPPCADFKFSPSGRTLGFLFGPEICGRGIMLMNTLTREIVYRSGLGGGHAFEFLRDGKALLTEGHCEGGIVSLYDPLRNVKTELGDAGLAWWTSNRNALAVAYGVYGQFNGGVWVFDALTDKLVKPPPAPENLEREDHAVWSRNGRYLIYQYREITSGDEVSFDGPRQVMRLDMNSGEISVLAGEDGYDFHLCAGNQNACTWYGGVWQQVRRIPFTPRAMPYNDSQAQACYLDGHGCEAETQLFALNVETGEMIPWEQAGLIEPQPTVEVSPTPVEDAPDFQVGPVYMHPSGFYAFYPGVDGRSLWLVPVEGAPVLWVQDGDNFTYIP